MSSSNSHWSRIAESGTVLGMRILIFVYQLLGRWGFQVGLFFVMSYYYLVKKQARNASKDYLQRFYKVYPANKNYSSFQHFLMFGEVLLDKFLAWMGKIQLSDIDFHSDGQFEATLKENRGGIIVISHLGNTEVSNALAHQQPNLKLTLLVYTQHAEKFNSLIKNVSSQTHIEMYQVTDMTPAFAMVMAERVANGEFLVIAGDRTPVTGQQRVSEVNFLGSPALFPQGAFILGSLLKCPIFLMFCLKQDQHYQIHLEHFAEQLNLPRKTRNELLEKTIQRYADRLATYTALAPLQWFNFYPFWLETTSKMPIFNKDEQ